jgi:flagellin
MPQVINTNMASLNAQRNLNSSQGALATSLQRLSSGLRINSAKDDAAGLAISQRFTAQIKGLNQAQRNANDGISLAQTAEGGLSTSGDILQRMRELAVQAANGTNSASDRASLQQEVTQLKSELTRIATTTQFNGQNVLDGSLSATQFQVGASANQTINIGIASAQATDIGNFSLKSTAGTTNSISNAQSANTSSGNNRVVAQTMTIAGNGKTSSFAVAAGAQASTIVTGINGTTTSTGVSAIASTEVKISGLSATGNVTFSLNGVAVGATVSNTNDLSSVATAVNAQSATTGVTATFDKSGGLTLKNSTGDDIKIQDFTNSGSGTVNVQGLDAFNNDATVGAAVSLATSGGGNDSTTVGGQIKFGSSSGYTIQTTDNTSNVFAGSGQQASALTAVSSLDISTIAGANDALSTIDAALTTINNSRASLGAIQNRFASTISNLSITAENLSAANSRIQDADFASETSALTRAQILQQAGTAMLAQANSVPNNVLSLLRG